MGRWNQCNNCSNSNDGDMMYICKHDNTVFCESCGDFTLNIAGNDNCICPVCHSTSDVRIMGEISTGVDETNCCQNCQNADPEDMLYQCKEDCLIFCQECGDDVYNINGNHNCICPICHLTSDVDILGTIGDDDHDGHKMSNIGEEDEDSKYSFFNGDDNDSSDSSRQEAYSESSEYDNYESSGSSDYSSSSGSSSGSSFTGILSIIVIAIVAYWIFSANRNSTPVNYVPQANLSVTTPDLIETPTMAVENPYGLGMGKVTFFQDCAVCEEIEISLDSSSIGTLSSIPTELIPECGASGTLALVVPYGARVFTLKNARGDIWQQQIYIVEGECSIVRVLSSAEVEELLGDHPDSLSQPVYETGGSAVGGNANTLHICQSCNGSGKMQASINCHFCSASGTMRCSSCGGSGHFQCRNCGGSSSFMCKVCGGSGSISQGDGSWRRCGSCRGGWIPCNKCKGGWINCSPCAGKGAIRCQNCSGEGQLIIEQACDKCMGRGSI
ncbi:MAG: hypothetical protein EOO88_37320 [Pedobacter sp.]|nr:MAG: hypothetical protein EOO88_37320 [Pedobacter sp.]